jgi:hypothetical protein
MFVCRGRFQGGVHSGKVQPAFRACNIGYGIGYGGREEVVPDYEVLVERHPRWVAAQDGHIPPDAVPVSEEHGGKEEKVNPYEVLVGH